MRFNKQRKVYAALALGCILTWSAGCASTPPASAPPAKAPAPAHAMVDVQKLLELHPSRAKLKQMEQALAAADDKAADRTAVAETARKEFETAMKIRENEDRAALEKKQTQLGDELNEQRRRFIEALETEYRSLLVNLDLKLKTIQLSPTDKQALEKERDRLEAERQQKLTAKEKELAERFQTEMNANAAEIRGQSETYANQWMEERMRRLEQAAVSPEREKQRQQIVELSGRMIEDVRAAVTKIAVQEKLEMVWIRPAVRKPLKDITDSVAREIANVK